VELSQQPDAVGSKMLGILYRTLATQLTRKAGYTKTAAQTDAVMLIQRFGGALNLNIHLHMRLLDGEYAPIVFPIRRIYFASMALDQ
jgi:hypothetical protein